VLGGSRPLAFQFPAANIPFSSTLHMFQPTFDTTTKEHLGWDQMEFGKVLATIDAPQQAEELGTSQLTQASVWTQPTQRRSAEGHQRAEGHQQTEGHRWAERHQWAEGHRMPHAHRRRPW
jgi:hypothetical protein